VPLVKVAENSSPLHFFVAYRPGCGKNDFAVELPPFQRSRTVAKFKVWLRPSGRDCKIRIDGLEHAALLCERLQSRGFNCTKPEPIANGRQCLVHASYPPQANEEDLEHFVSELPEIELMLDPA
jgi:hypothetical protein